jgi:TPR repeat protein
VGLRGVKEGVQWVERAAGNGSEAAVECLAELLLEGECVHTDHARAYSLFRKLALSGSARNASWKVGYCLDHGYGVACNKTAAVEWYLKAAEEDDVPQAMIKYMIIKYTINNRLIIPQRLSGI